MADNKIINWLARPSNQVLTLSTVVFVSCLYGVSGSLSEFRLQITYVNPEFQGKLLSIGLIISLVTFVISLFYSIRYVFLSQQQTIADYASDIEKTKATINDLNKEIENLENNKSGLISTINEQKQTISKLYSVINENEQRYDSYHLSVSHQFDLITMAIRGFKVHPMVINQHQVTQIVDQTITPLILQPTHAKELTNESRK